MAKNNKDDDNIVANLRDRRWLDRIDDITSHQGKLLIEAADKIEELDKIFELRWEADMRAIRRWQQAHPERGGLVWPDHADLVMFLMEELDKFRKL